MSQGSRHEKKGKRGPQLVPWEGNRSFNTTLPKNQRTSSSPSDLVPPFLAQYLSEPSSENSATPDSTTTNMPTDAAGAKPHPPPKASNPSALKRDEPTSTSGMPRATFPPETSKPWAGVPAQATTWGPPYPPAHDAPHLINHVAAHLVNHDSHYLINHDAAHLTNHDAPHLINHDAPHLINHDAPHLVNLQQRFGRSYDYQQASGSRKPSSPVVPEPAAPKQNKTTISEASEPTITPETNKPRTTPLDARSNHASTETFQYDSDVPPTNWSTLFNIFLGILVISIFQQKEHAVVLGLLGTLLVATQGLGNLMIKRSKQLNTLIDMPGDLNTIVLVLTLFFAYYTLRSDFQPAQLLCIGVALLHSIGLGTWVADRSAALGKKPEMPSGWQNLSHGFLALIGFLTYTGRTDAYILLGVCVPLIMSVTIGGVTAFGEAATKKPSAQKTFKGCKTGLHN
ncbi:MAG: hypothetical protein M1820_007848 [Bogoriella megaspora]|nr:MAG: hypothetical protein M1820_007848 [Bogoriella megaspora]